MNHMLCADGAPFAWINETMNVAVKREKEAGDAGNS